jgi:hypothetical protein
VVSRPTLTSLLGFEPPLPGELDAARWAIANTTDSNPTTVRRPKRRRPTDGDGQASLFSA